MRPVNENDRHYGGVLRLPKQRRAEASGGFAYRKIAVLMVETPHVMMSDPIVVSNLLQGAMTQADLMLLFPTRISAVGLGYRAPMRAACSAPLRSARGPGESTGVLPFDIPN